MVTIDSYCQHKDPSNWLHNPPKIIKSRKQKAKIVKLSHAEEATRLRVSKFDSMGQINLVSEHVNAFALEDSAIDTQTPLSH